METVCGNACTTLLTDHDRDEIGTFTAFLKDLSAGLDGQTKLSMPLRWQDVQYIRGTGPGLPLVWRGDDS